MKVAVLGCGTIGGGVVKILLDGVKGLKLVKILDKKERFVEEYLSLYTDDINEILNDDSIDAVVEVMGGHDFSYFCIKNALLKGKHVVTANKEVIALHMKELTSLAEEKGVYLMYEASAGGGIPCLKTLSNLAKINKTSEVYGILNGTTNFILTKMQDENMTYDVALKEAQRLGFAEYDPTADIEGLDMVRKIAIISMLCYHQEISIDDVYHYGIKNVTKGYIDYVNKLGYTLKLMCFSSLTDSIDIGVEPVLVKANSLPAGVKYENNFVSVNMQPNDLLTFTGKGAGRMPTATAIVADLVVANIGGEKMAFEDVNKYKVGIKDSKINAIVDNGNGYKLLKDVSSDSVRHGNYNFYARIID